MANVGSILMPGNEVEAAALFDQYVAPGDARQGDDVGLTSLLSKLSFRRSTTSSASRRRRCGSRNAARATASASIGSDLPRIRPLRRCGAISFGGTRTNDSPAASSARSSAPPQLPTILDSPQPLRAKRRRPGNRLARRADRQLRDRAPTSSTATAVNDCLWMSTPTTIIQIASSNAGGDRRADGPQSRQQPRSYQVTLGGLGKAAATQRWQVSPRATCGNRVSRRPPSLRRSPDATTHRQ